MASPGLEGGQVADLSLYARSSCSILLYRGWAHHSNELSLKLALRTSENSVKAKFAEYFLPRTPVNKGKKKGRV